ncbi:MAG: 4-hydroxy-tetrahydrodipicolinate reductase, partial [Clostridia bacterium]|nr:4-hydroxy-tetrahydrodipicolinate reductase [Clostridia bacterium]
MIKVILSGCGGRMGKAVAAAVGNEARIVAGVDINAASIDASDFPIYESITEFSDKADVIVDFSHHSALPSLLDYAKATKTPVVVATTGHTDEELALMREAASEVAIFHSGNFSIGINLIINLAKQA